MVHHISARECLSRKNIYLVQMMQRMLENKFRPTEAAFAMALMSAGRLGRAEFAKVLFEWRQASGLESKQEIYSSVGAVGDGG